MSDLPKTYRRVVLVRNGRAEEGQERIAGELLHVSAVAPDQVGERGDDRVDDLEQLLRIELLR